MFVEVISVRISKCVNHAGWTVQSKIVEVFQDPVLQNQTFLFSEDTHMAVEKLTPTILCRWSDDD